MAKKSIGQFIAALRKANGMTQQEIADRLNVSNKAVSRWERDECAPDISLIPALAEMLGVTCDELLKGERILDIDTSKSTELKEPKVDKQVKALINRTLSNFKTFIWIALAASVIGLVLMFGISYGFYRPFIGFCVMLLFEVVSLAITIVAVTNAKDAKRDNEVFEMAYEAQITHYHSVIGKLSFWSFYAILVAVTVSVPFILFASDIFINSVLTPGAFFIIFICGILPILAIVYLKCRSPYIAWMTTGKRPHREASAILKASHRMNWLQIGLMLLASIFFVISPWFDTSPDETSVALIAVICVGLASIIASVIVFVSYIIKEKDARKELVFSGIRNVFLLPAVLMISQMHGVSWWNERYNDAESTDWVRDDLWSKEYLWYAAAYCLVVVLLFAVIDVLVMKRQNVKTTNNEKQ